MYASTFRKIEYTCVHAMVKHLVCRQEMTLVCCVTFAWFVPYIHLIKRDDSSSWLSRSIRAFMFQNAIKAANV